MKDRKLYEEQVIAKEALREWATQTKTSQFILNELDKLGSQKKKVKELRKEGKLPEEVLDKAEKELTSRIDDLIKVYEQNGAKVNAINRILLKMDPEDVAFIKYKYSKEMQVEEISNTMHISRATYFRWQKKIINKMIPLMKEEGWNFDV